MQSILYPGLAGKSFTLAIPQTNAPDSPDWLVFCVIERVTSSNIHVFFCCQEWLSASFDLPTPKNIDNLWYSIYLSVGEMIADERIEFLCSL